MIFTADFAQVWRNNHWDSMRQSFISELTRSAEWVSQWEPVIVELDSFCWEWDEAIVILSVWFLLFINGARSLRSQRRYEGGKKSWASKLSFRISKCPQFNYHHLKEHRRLIISYLRNFQRYRWHDPLEIILGGRMRSVLPKADGTMNICNILAAFFEWMANFFDDNLIGIEL
jgi:hypothetical protein